MACLLDAAASLFVAKPQEDLWDDGNELVEWSYPPREEVRHLIRQREKNWDEFLACVDQPDVLFVNLTIKAAKAYPVDVMEMPFVRISWIESEMFYQCRSSKRLKAAVQADRDAVRKYKDFFYDSEVYGWGSEYPEAGQQGETLKRIVKTLKENYPDRKLILVGQDTRWAIRKLSLICPEAATYFADAICFKWLCWYTRPEAGHLGYTQPKAEAPTFDVFHTLDDPGRHHECTFEDIKRWFDRPEHEAPHRRRIGPDKVVKPEPDAPFAARIYSQHKSRLPGTIASTERLASYIERLGCKPVSVGTWGPAFMTRRWRSRSIHRLGKSYGWACFEDLASLEAFVAKMDDTEVDRTLFGTKTVGVVILHSTLKPVSLTSTQTSHPGQEQEQVQEQEREQEQEQEQEQDKEQQGTLSLEGRTEVEETTTPGPERQPDGLGEELRWIEPLNLGESLDMGELMDVAMHLPNSC